MPKPRKVCLRCMEPANLTDYIGDGLYRHVDCSADKKERRIALKFVPDITVAQCTRVGHLDGSCPYYESN